MKNQILARQVEVLEKRLVNQMFDKSLQQQTFYKQTKQLNEELVKRVARLEHKLTTMFAINKAFGDLQKMVREVARDVKQVKQSQVISTDKTANKKNLKRGNKQGKQSQVISTDKTANKKSKRKK